MAQADTAHVSWLKSLSPQSSRNLYNVLYETVDPIDETASAFPANFRYFQTLNPGVSNLRTGADWIDYTTCSKIPVGAAGVEMGAGYPRLQIQFNRTGPNVPFKTPHKRIHGLDPLGKRFKSALTAEEWAAFKGYCLSGTGTSNKVSVKIMCHHIVYNAKAKTAGGAIAELPSGTGAGASVEHLCDNKCIKEAHLVATTTHALNLERQGCPGALLLCHGGVIMQVINCPHLRIDPQTGKVLSAMCTRMQIVQLQFAPAATAEYQAARAEFLRLTGAANQVAPGPGIVAATEAEPDTDVEEPTMPFGVV